MQILSSTKHKSENLFYIFSKTGSRSWEWLFCILSMLPEAFHAENTGKMWPDPRIWLFPSALPCLALHFLLSYFPLGSQGPIVNDMKIIQFF